MNNDGRKGFTLIEILVVVAILALLAAILLPVFAQSRAKSQATTCISNLSQLGKAERMYLSDYDGYYAPDLNVQNIFNKAKQFSGCPTAGDNERKSLGMPGYAHNGQLHGFQILEIRSLHEDQILAPTVTVAVAEVTGESHLTGWEGKKERSRRHHEGGNFLFCDGHVKWYLPDTVSPISGWSTGKAPTFNPHHHVPN